MNTTFSSKLAPLAFTSALILAGCSKGSNSTTSDATPTSTTGDNTSTTDVLTTGTPTTTGSDPCDACSPDALCQQDGTCECKEGFSGNGLQCDDVDECATGKDNCSADAACANTPGGFTCACNDGYEGDGFDCKDVDECATTSTNNCSPLADCANTYGSFQCTCKDGFSGNGVSCKGNKPYGDACTISDECASGICLNGNPGQCTILCSQQVAHDCRDQGESGLCIATTDDPNTFVCVGDINGGADSKDDTVMVPGDSVMRIFDNKTDLDVFLIKHGTKNINFSATPDIFDDLRIEVFDAGGNELGFVDNEGVGVAESASLDVEGTAGVAFIIVRNIGESNGSYLFSVDNL